MTPFGIAVVFVTLIVATLANDLIPNCPDPSDGKILSNGINGIAEVLTDAAEELPGGGKFFKIISIMLAGLGLGKDDEKLEFIIDQMKAYVDCEIVVSDQRQNSQQMVNDLKSYGEFLHGISVGSPTHKEYMGLLYHFFTLTVKPEQFINSQELTSNVEFLRYAIAIHLGAGLEMISACVHFNNSQCLEYRDKWNYFYSLYMPYAESVVPKAVDWRMNFVKLTCTPGTDYCTCVGIPGMRCHEVCICKDTGYYIDSFVSTKKLHNTNRNCNEGAHKLCTKDCSLVKDYEGYRAQIQARMTKHFAQPISDWKAWYNKLNAACPVTVRHGKIVIPKTWDSSTAGMKRQLVCRSGSTYNVTCQWPKWSPAPPACK